MLRVVLRASATELDVEVYPEPVPLLTGTDTSCVGATGIVYATDAGMTTYNWIVSAEGSVTSWWWSRGQYRYGRVD